MQPIQASHALAWLHGPLRATASALRIVAVHSFPVCDLIAKWAIVFIVVSFDLPQLLVLFYFVFLPGLFHHEFGYASSFEARLAFGVFFAAEVDVVGLLLAFWARYSCNYGLETGTAIITASLNHLIILTDILKAAFVLEHHMAILYRLPPLCIRLPLGLELALPAKRQLRLHNRLLLVDVPKWQRLVAAHCFKAAAKALEHRLLAFADSHQGLSFDVWHTILETKEVAASSLLTWTVVAALLAVVGALHMALLAFRNVAHPVPQGVLHAEAAKVGVGVVWRQLTALFLLLLDVAGREPDALEQFFFWC
jgi:hypothetical protein